jgi:hypothetical protein
MTSAEMERVLGEINKILPDRATPYEIAMLVSYICHRYLVPTSSGVMIFAHVLDFLDTQQGGPRSKFEIN